MMAIGVPAASAAGGIGDSVLAPAHDRGRVWAESLGVSHDRRDPRDRPTADRPSPDPEGGPLTTATRRLTTPTPRPRTIPAALDRACLAARTAADNKGRDVVVLDMRGVTPIYDFLVLATGASRRQMHTLAEETDAALAKAGDRRLSIEGYESSRWIVQDYGDVVVHVFEPESREYYALEDLWADARRVDWERE